MYKSSRVERKLLQLLTMQLSQDKLNDTTTKLTVTADKEVLEAAKLRAVKRLSKNLKVQGFRPGKAPLHILEKQLDQNYLQSEFLEDIVNQLYVEAAQELKLRPVSQPQVTIKKFVPFTELEIDYEVEIIGAIVLPDYSKYSVTRKPVTVVAKDIDDVLTNMRTRGATRKTVKRAALDGDSVVLDFTGTDAKTKAPIAGADGSDYSLVLGSKSFIPGFEEEVIGLKAGESKEFVITFPADYGSVELQKKKVNFAISVKEVQAVELPKLDDSFAKNIGPFESLAALKTDIKKQLTDERNLEADREYDNELLEKIAKATKITVPDSLIEDEIDRIEAEEKRNLVYRGQTWQEHLDAEGVDEKQHREKNRDGAVIRVKAGLVLAQVAEVEDIVVSPDELNIQVELLRGRYTDPTMQAELDKPENRRELMSRMISEKSMTAIKSNINGDKKK
jgi:trigger factor